MKSLEQRIEAIERSAKRWKLAALAAVGLCCFVGAGDREVTFDVVNAREFRCVNGTETSAFIGDGFIACRKIAITSGDAKTPACVMGCNADYGTGYMTLNGFGSDTKGKSMSISSDHIFKKIGDKLLDSF